jgi:hypothetical protein
MLRTFCNQRFVRQQHKFIDWTKQASRSNIREEHNKHTGQRICSQRSLPLRKATSPLRYPQRAGYYEEPFASSQLTTKEVRNPRKKAASTPHPTEGDSAAAVVCGPCSLASVLAAGGGGAGSVSSTDLLSS